MPKAKTRPQRKSAAPFDPPQWPAARVEMRALSKIKPYPNNPRTHPEAQIEKLAASMKEDGVTMPILVDEAWVIIAGHGRRLAAVAAGFEEYPVVVARGWSEEQKRAVRLKDNQVSMLSGWDAELIRSEIKLLDDAGYDTKLLGFEDAQLIAFTIPFEQGDLDVNGAWGGMPEFNQQDKQAFRSIVVHFKDQEAIDAFAKKNKVVIGEKTRFLWFPEAEIERYVDKTYKQAARK